MESLALVLLLIVLGGGALLVGLVFAIVTGSARSDRLRRLEQEQMSLRAGLDAAAGRVAQLERALGEAMHRLSYVRAEQIAIEARAAEHPAAAEPAPAVEPAREAQAAVSSEPQVAPAAAAPEVTALPEAAAPVPPEAPLPEAPATPAEPAPAAMAPAAEAPAAAPPEAPAAEAAPPVAGPVVPVWPSPAPATAAPVAEGLAEAARVADPPALPLPPEGAPPPPPSSRAPEPPPARFDWERWVGVRGAAALGACVLVIAGLYFFKYSIDNELISPAMRVVLGVLVGLGGLAGSELTLRRSYTVLANWLAGAGVAILYTAFWFAHQLGLVPGVVAFGLMILVTAACGLLAVRHDAMVIALLGLAGGFSTPVALSTGEDHPFGLFGYLLLLDGALLYLARQKRWSVLAALSLVGTALYQAAWIGVRMGPDRLLLGMGVLVVFGGVYAFAAPAAASEKDEGDLWGLTRVATVLLPFAFGLYFGLRADLGDRLYPLGLMLCVVGAGAGWIARARAISWAGPVAAVAATTVIGVWLVVHDAAAVAWEASLVPALLAAVFHGFVELEARRPHPDTRAATARAAAISCLGTLFCLAAAACVPAALDPWPWLGGWLVLGALAVRQSLLPGYGAIRFGLSFLVTVGLTAVHYAHADALAFPAERFFLAGLLAVTGLGLLSAALVARDDGSPATDALAALLPFVTTVYFASRGELGPHPTPLAIAAGALAAGSLWAARARREAAWVAAGAAILGLGTLAVWLVRHAPATVPGEVSLVVCAFAAVFAAFVEGTERRGEDLSPMIGRWAALTSLGGVALLAATATSPGCVPPWPFLAGWTVLGAMALRQLSLPGREPLHLALAITLGLAFPAAQGVHADEAAFPAAAVWLAAALLTAVAFLGASFAQREGPGARWAAHGAGTLSLLLLLAALAGSAAPAPATIVLPATLALALVACVVAARLGAGGWSFAAVVATAFVQTGWTFEHVTATAGSAEQVTTARAALLGQGLAVVVLAGWPLVAGKRLQASRWAWRAAALAGPLWFLCLHHAFKGAFGGGALGLLPVALGAVTLGVAWRARPLLPDDTRRSALVWLLGVTVGAVSLAVPLQLHDEWITVGWALEGVALLLLWRRLDHAGLKYTALAHLAIVAARLTVNPWVLDYHPRSGVPVLNWLAYTYWLPTLALLGAFLALRDLEVPRRRPWEGSGPRPALAMTMAAAAIVVFFVWINLTIFDAFGTGPALTVELQRLPARDLTLSLAWAIYALFLLGVGMARRSAALRWTSLALIIVTIGKVFLYDLSHLHDLYRVMSLVGLAFSLILISLAYQRFVFGRREEGAG